MHVLKVGQPLIPGQTVYPQSTRFEYTSTGPMLIICMPALTRREIEAARKGRVELALYDHPPVIFVLCKIEGLLDWSDCPFSVRLCKDEIDLSLPIEEGKGLGLQIVLVESTTGIVKALRLVGTSTEFARELRAAMVKQTIRPFSPDEYDRAIAEVYALYTSDQLLKRATARHAI